jgi:hypothetical protein
MTITRPFFHVPGSHGRVGSMTKPNGKPCSRCGIRPKAGKFLCTECIGRCAACGGDAYVRSNGQFGTHCTPCARAADMAKNVNCVRCGELRDGSHPSYCRTCYRAYDRARAKTPDARTKDRAKHRRYALGAYRLTVEQWQAMFDAQDGRCAICSTDTPGGKGRFHVDHCHVSGRVRALLCSRCNVMLGMAGDDITRLRAAIAYLARHATPPNEPQPDPSRAE